MPKYFHFLLIFAALSIPLASCDSCVRGQGAVQEEERILPEFNQLEIDCDARLILHNIADSSKNKLTIHCQPDLFPIITSKVQGGKLILTNARCFSTDFKVELHAYVRRLDHLDVNSSADISCDSLFSGDKMTIVQQGSGTIRFNCVMNEFHVEQTGSGDVITSGHGNTLHIESSGSGRTDCRNFINNQTQVNLTGTGDVYVHAIQAADLNLHGSGSIHYVGRPANLNTHNDGSGEIRQIQ